VAFTGHSLGGSLGTLLMLMYVHRGVLPISAVAPVYTFGAPAVFCEGGLGGQCACGDECPLDFTGGGADGEPFPAAPAPSAAGSIAPCAPASLLTRMGLPDDAVRNVFMHKDIVPRAFACDYALVSDLLRRVGEGFREHRCLNSARPLLFNFVGQQLVLQPDAGLRFVLPGEGYHPMLPQGGGLYLLRQVASPAPGSGGGSGGHPEGELRFGDDGAGGEAAAADALHAAGGSTDQQGQQARAPGRRIAGSVREAIWELMNNPHPLEILGDPAAYGDQGGISRCVHTWCGYLNVSNGYCYFLFESVVLLLSSITFYWYLKVFRFFIVCVWRWGLGEGGVMCDAGALTVSRTTTHKQQMPPPSPPQTHPLTPRPSSRPPGTTTPTTTRARWAVCSTRAHRGAAWWRALRVWACASTRPTSGLAASAPRRGTGRRAAAPHPRVARPASLPCARSGASRRRRSDPPPPPHHPTSPPPFPPLGARASFPFASSLPGRQRR
jgi:hypothetical protein